MENVRKHQDMKLVTTGERRNWHQNQVIIKQSFS